MMIAVVAALIVGLAYLNAGGLSSSAGTGQADEAYFAARSGIAQAQQSFLAGTACGAGLQATSAVGAGSFTLSGATQYNVSSSTVAAGGITSTATTVPVGAMGAYAPFGRIVIDSEEMYYGAISGANFINVKRGLSNTVAAIHSAGATVYQALCNITATGTVDTANRVLLANMPLQFFQTGVIGKKNTAGTGAVSYTGIGFKPTTVIFYWTEQIATGFTANGVGTSSGMGFATASSQYAAVTGMADNTGTSLNGRRKSASNAIIFQTVTSAPVLLAQANLQSMDADGFTLNWNVNGDTNAYRIYYIAIGGDTQASVGNFNLNNAVGAQSVTGTGFQPDLLMFIHAANGAVDTDLANAEFGVGFAQGASARNALVYAGASAINTGIAPVWQQLTNRAILFLDPTVNSPTATGQADFTSMDANGFTVNVTTASGGAGWNVGYLALRGARVGTGAFNQPTVTGSQVPVSSLAFRPKGMMLASRSLATAATLAAGRTAIGAAGSSPIVDGNIWFHEVTGVNTSDANASNDATNVIAMGANANASTNTAQAIVQSLNLGGFTLNWGAADAVVREVLYWAIGPRDYADIRERY